jgi:hypothetical protein
MVTRSLLLLALLLPLVCHCGGALDGQEGAPAALDQSTVPEDPESATEPTPLPEIVLSPSAEMLDATEDWAKRWSAATGRDIRVGEGGSVIVAEDVVTSEDGTRRLCGGIRLSTGIRVARIQAATCPGMYETLGHELGHLLGADAHSDEGDVMAVSSDPQPITAKGLALVCPNLGCPIKTPER